MDYQKLDVVNCRVGNNMFTKYIKNHEAFYTLINEGLWNLPPDSVPEWIHSHLARDAMQMLRKLLTNFGSD